MRTIHVDTRSERGIALIVVLLMMAVLSGLATGFAMNGRVESGMAQNETYYAGARAAAEAGINRATAAVRLEINANLLSGEDGVAGNADDGDLGFLLTGAAPYALDASGQYSYTVEVLDDDDPALYNGTNLSADQLVAMGGEGAGGVPDPSTDHNTRLILRATGFGPQNTVVRVSRVLLTTIIPIPGTTVNPAILVDGDVEVTGNIRLLTQLPCPACYGSIHSNGDLVLAGNAAVVEGDATASGDFTANQNFEAEGKQGGGYSNVNVPEITTDDYASIADYVLNDNGTITYANGLPCAVGCPANTGDWTFSDPDGLLGPQMGTWTISGNTAPAGTFYVEGKVSISGSPKGAGNSAIKMSLVAEGSISITGSPKFAPDNTNNPEAIMFVTDGDLFLGGASDLDDPTQIEGQIFVREQIHTQGNPEFQGRIIVQNDANDFNDVTLNSIGGTPTITYNGTLPNYVIPPTTEYTYNVTGWIEQ
jgi:hypothetical protein